MKINGISILPPDDVIVPIIRETGNIIFKCKAVLDMSDFEKLVPMPIPPTVVKKDGKKFQDVEDAKYKKEADERGLKYSHYLILKSLEATPGLTWDTVKMGDPSTWHLYDKELRETGLVETEIARIMQGMMEANSLSQDKFEEAKKSFLASQLPVA